MAKQTINIGTTANDRTGDTLRGAFNKINANFTELYTALGNIPVAGIPGPYDDDAAAAIAGVAVGYPYHKTGTSGQVFVRLA